MSLGALVASTDADERRALAAALLASLTPVDDHIDEWAALLAEPGLVRYAALALFAHAAGDLPGNWRAAGSPRVQADFEGLGDVLVLGEDESEEPFDRLLAALVEGGPKAARADLLGLVDTLVARHRDADEELARALVTRLEAWRASSLR